MCDTGLGSGDGSCEPVNNDKEEIIRMNRDFLTLKKRMVVADTLIKKVEKVWAFNKKLISANAKLAFNLKNHQIDNNELSSQLNELLLKCRPLEEENKRLKDANETLEDSVAACKAKEKQMVELDNQNKEKISKLQSENAALIKKIKSLEKLQSTGCITKSKSKGPEIDEELSDSDCSLMDVPIGESIDLTRVPSSILHPSNNLLNGIQHLACSDSKVPHESVCKSSPSKEHVKSFGIGTDNRMPKLKSQNTSKLKKYTPNKASHNKKDMNSKNGKLFEDCEYDEMAKFVDDGFCNSTDDDVVVSKRNIETSISTHCDTNSNVGGNTPLKYKKRSPVKCFQKDSSNVKVTKRKERLENDTQVEMSDSSSSDGEGNDPNFGIELPKSPIKNNKKDVNPVPCTSDVCAANGFIRPSSTLIINEKAQSPVKNVIMDLDLSSDEDDEFEDVVEKNDDMTIHNHLMPKESLDNSAFLSPRKTFAEGGKNSTTSDSDIAGLKDNSLSKQIPNEFSVPNNMQSKDKDSSNAGILNISSLGVTNSEEASHKSISKVLNLSSDGDDGEEAMEVEVSSCGRDLSNGHSNALFFISNCGDKNQRDTLDDAYRQQNPEENVVEEPLNLSSIEDEISSTCQGSEDGFVEKLTIYAEMLKEMEFSDDEEPSQQNDSCSVTHSLQDNFDVSVQKNSDPEPHKTASSEKDEPQFLNEQRVTCRSDVNLPLELDGEGEISLRNNQNEINQLENNVEFMETGECPLGDLKNNEESIEQAEEGNQASFGIQEGIVDRLGSTFQLENSCFTESRGPEIENVIKECISVEVPHVDDEVCPKRDINDMDVQSNKCRDHLESAKNNEVNNHTQDDQDINSMNSDKQSKNKNGFVTCDGIECPVEGVNFTNVNSNVKIDKFTSKQIISRLFGTSEFMEEKEENKENAIPSFVHDKEDDSFEDLCISSDSSDDEEDSQCINLDLESKSVDVVSGIMNSMNMIMDVPKKNEAVASQTSEVCGKRKRPHSPDSSHEYKKSKIDQNNSTDKGSSEKVIHCSSAQNCLKIKKCLPTSFRASGTNLTYDKFQKLNPEKLSSLVDLPKPISPLPEAHNIQENEVKQGNIESLTETTIMPVINGIKNMETQAFSLRTNVPINNIKESKSCYVSKDISKKCNKSNVTIISSAGEVGPFLIHPAEKTAKRGKNICINSTTLSAAHKSKAEDFHSSITTTNESNKAKVDLPSVTLVNKISKSCIKNSLSSVKPVSKSEMDRKNTNVQLITSSTTGVNSSGELSCSHPYKMAHTNFMKEPLINPTSSNDIPGTYKNKTMVNGLIKLGSRKTSSHLSMKSPSGAQESSSYLDKSKSNSKANENKVNGHLTTTSSRNETCGPEDGVLPSHLSKKTPQNFKSDSSKILSSSHLDKSKSNSKANESKVNGHSTTTSSRSETCGLEDGVLPSHLSKKMPQNFKSDLSKSVQASVNSSLKADGSLRSEKESKEDIRQKSRLAPVTTECNKRSMPKCKNFTNTFLHMMQAYSQPVNLFLSKVQNCNFRNGDFTKSMVQAVMSSTLEVKGNWFMKCKRKETSHDVPWVAPPTLRAIEFIFLCAQNHKEIGFCLVESFLQESIHLIVKFVTSKSFKENSVYLLCTAFVAILRIQGNMERARMLLYEVVKNSSKVRLCTVIMTLCAVWPQCLAKDQGSNFFAIQQVLNHYILTSIDQQNAIKNFVKQLSGLESECQSTTDLASRLFDRVNVVLKQENVTEDFAEKVSWETQTAILLMCSKEGWVWASSVIISLLWSFLGSWANKNGGFSDYFIQITVELLGSCLKQYLDMVDKGNFNNIFGNLKLLVLESSVPTKIREAALRSILRLSNPSSSPVDIIKSIIHFKNEFSQSTLELLKDFVF